MNSLVAAIMGLAGFGVASLAGRALRSLGFFSLAFGLGGGAIGPRLARIRIAANETAAIANLRTIHSAEVIVKRELRKDADGDGIGEYCTFSEDCLLNPPLLDPQLAAASKQGYIFVIVVGSGGGTNETTWHATAIPRHYNGSGIRAFYIDERGIVVGHDTGAVQTPSRPLLPGFPSLFTPVRE